MFFFFFVLFVGGLCRKRSLHYNLPALSSICCCKSNYFVSQSEKTKKKRNFNCDPRDLNEILGVALPDESLKFESQASKDKLRLKNLFLLQWQMDGPATPLVCYCFLIVFVNKINKINLQWLQLLLFAMEEDEEKEEKNFIYSIVLCFFYFYFFE